MGEGLIGILRSFDPSILRESRLGSNLRMIGRLGSNLTMIVRLGSNLRMIGRLGSNLRMIVRLGSFLRMLGRLGSFLSMSRCINVFFTTKFGSTGTVTSSVLWDRRVSADPGLVFLGSGKVKLVAWHLTVWLIRRAVSVKVRKCLTAARRYAFQVLFMEHPGWMPASLLYDVLFLWRVWRAKSLCPQKFRIRRRNLPLKLQQFLKPIWHQKLWHGKAANADITLLKNMIYRRKIMHLINFQTQRLLLIPDW